MSANNKLNLVYFEKPTMRELYTEMEAWQLANQKRLQSVSVQKDGGHFCCIALTNPTEVVITNYQNDDYVRMENGWLCVYTSS